MIFTLFIYLFFILPNDFHFVWPKSRMQKNIYLPGGFFCCPILIIAAKCNANAECNNRRKM